MFQNSRPKISHSFPRKWTAWPVLKPAGYIPQESPGHVLVRSRFPSVQFVKATTTMLPGPCNVSWLLICKNLEVTAIYHLRIGKRFRSAFEIVLQNPQLVAWLLGMHRKIKPMLLASLKSSSFKKGDGFGPGVAKWSDCRLYSPGFETVGFHTRCIQELSCSLRPYRL